MTSPYLKSSGSRSRELGQDWEIAKLLKLGVDPVFVSGLDQSQLLDLTKGLIYLSEKYLSQS